MIQAPTTTTEHHEHHTWTHVLSKGAGKVSPMTFTDRMLAAQAKIAKGEEPTTALERTVAAHAALSARTATCAWCGLPVHGSCD